MLVEQPRVDIATLKRVRIAGISETGCFDHATLIGDIKAAGGMQVSPYVLPWPPFGDLHPENAVRSAGSVSMPCTVGCLSCRSRSGRLRGTREGQPGTVRGPISSRATVMSSNGKRQSFRGWSSRLARSAPQRTGRCALRP